MRDTTQQQQNVGSPGSARALRKLIGSSRSAAADSGGGAASDTLPSPSVMSPGILSTIFFFGTKKIFLYELNIFWRSYLTLLKIASVARLPLCLCAHKYSGSLATGAIVAHLQWHGQHTLPL